LYLDYGRPGGLYANIVVDDGTTELWTSFLDHPLLAPVEAVMLLLKEVEHVEARWQEDPGEYRWLLARRRARIGHDASVR